MYGRKTITTVAGGTALLLGVLTVGGCGSGGPPERIACAAEDRDRAAGHVRGDERLARNDDRRRAGPHALPLPARLGHHKQGAPAVRRLLAPTPATGTPIGRPGEKASNLASTGRAGRERQMQRTTAAALPLHGRPEARRCQRPGRGARSGPVVRRVSGRRPDHDAGAEQRPRLLGGAPWPASHSARRQGDPGQHRRGLRARPRDRRRRGRRPRRPVGVGQDDRPAHGAGLEEVSEGVVMIGERVVDCVPSRDRDIAIVFQSYALYPQ